MSRVVVPPVSIPAIYVANQKNVWHSVNQCLTQCRWPESKEKPPKPMETTGKSLVEHWSWAANKGIMNRNTAAALGAACSQVMKALDNWENIDVSKLDADDALRRFTNLRKKDFKPASLRSYERRFRNALASYLSYVRDPGAWKPVVQERPARNDRGVGGRLNAAQSDEATQTAVPSQHAETSRHDLADYQFPLRKNLSARLILPRDLQESEAKRLQAYIALLVMNTEAKTEAEVS